MKIAIINMISEGSTGSIMFETANIARMNGHKVKTFSTTPFVIHGSFNKKEIPNHFYFGYKTENMIHYAVSQLTMKNGFYSVIGTIELVKKLKQFAPDIVHLHNLHGFCICLPILFSYINKNEIQVIWTLHDCWTFTGKCPHYLDVKCIKWKTGCYLCPQLCNYPKARIDKTKKLWKIKRHLINSLHKLIIVTPSVWLEDQVKESFLSNVPTKVINNGIDLSVFKPTASTIKKQLKIEDKYIILGVAFSWSNKKGLDVFCKLGEELSDEFRIILVGITPLIASSLPSSIIGVPKTSSKKELAEFYTAADLFFNPTREDTFPTVNIEALSCGTPVLTFNVGGSAEIITESTGRVLNNRNPKEIATEICRIKAENRFRREDCRERARLFDKNEKYKEYVKLYESFGG